MKFFQGRKPGPSALIFSGIHGDEISGVRALERFENELESWMVELESGNLTIVSRCNERAILANVPFVDENLNRCFFKGQCRESYEWVRARELMPYFEGKDFFLDLHSTSEKSVPFVFSEWTNLEFAKKLGIPFIISGWAELGNQTISGDTEGYMNASWGVGFTFEAGSHADPNGEKNAYQAILNFLSALKMVDGTLFQPIENTDVVALRMSSVYVAETADWKFALPNRENLTPLKKGQTIGFDGTKEVMADSDCRLIMPKKTPPAKGEEVFFIGNIVS